MKKVGRRKLTWANVASGEWRCSGNYIKVLERDNYACAICGSNDKPIVHHLDGNPKNNKENNLLTVCYKCHADLHGLTVRVKNPRADLILDLREQGKTFQEVA